MLLSLALFHPFTHGSRFNIIVNFVYGWKRGCKIYLVTRLWHASGAYAFQPGQPRSHAFDLAACSWPAGQHMRTSIAYTLLVPRPPATGRVRKYLLPANKCQSTGHMGTPPKLRRQIGRRYYVRVVPFISDFWTLAPRSVGLASFCDLK